MQNWLPGQRIAVYAAGLVALFMFLFPPMGSAGTYGRNLWVGYRFLFDPDANHLVTDWTRLFVQYVFVGGIAWFAFSIQKRPDAE